MNVSLTEKEIQEIFLSVEDLASKHAFSSDAIIDIINNYMEKSNENKAN